MEGGEEGLEIGSNLIPVAPLSWNRNVRQGLEIVGQGAVGRDLKTNHCLARKKGDPTALFT